MTVLITTPRRMNWPIAAHLAQVREREARHRDAGPSTAEYSLRRTRVLAVSGQGRAEFLLAAPEPDQDLVSLAKVDATCGARNRAKRGAVNGTIEGKGTPADDRLSLATSTRGR
jgi:hypothetical protein